MGSSALAQQVDIAYSLSGEPARGEISAKKLKNDKCRAIQGVGRYADAIRDPIAVELTETGYVLSEFKGDEGSKETAVEFLTSFFADGPKGATEVTSEGEQMGLGYKTLRAALHSLGGKPKKKSKYWEWELPHE
jgi:hypothetical protein